MGVSFNPLKGYFIFSTEAASYANMLVELPPEFTIPFIPQFFGSHWIVSEWDEPARVDQHSGGERIGESGIQDRQTLEVNICLINICGLTFYGQ